MTECSERCTYLFRQIIRAEEEGGVLLSFSSPFFFFDFVFVMIVG